METKDINLIRLIYQHKKNLFDYPDLREKLFHKYYPQLDFKKFYHADIWHCIVFMDYCGDLMSINNNPLDQEDMGFGDIPGPVG